MLWTDVESGGQIQLNADSLLTVNDTSNIRCGANATGAAPGIQICDGGNLHIGATAAASGGATLTVHPHGLVSILSGATMTIASGATVTIAAGTNVTITDTFPKLTGTGVTSYAEVFDLCGPVPFGSGWSATIDGLSGPASTNTVQIAIPPRCLHNGARLHTAVLYFTVVAHGGLPAADIQFGITARAPVAGSDLPARALVASAAAYTHGTLADYNSGLVKILTYQPDITIDTATKQYAILIEDEHSTNSVAGNVFHQIVLNFDTVPSLAFI